MHVDDVALDRAARVCYALLYEDAHFQPPVLTSDREGPFAAVILALEDFHNQVALLSAQTGKLYDAWTDARTVFEGLRVADDGTQQIGRLDQAIRQIATTQIELPPGSTNGTKPRLGIDYAVDWRQQGITLRQLQNKHFDPEKWIIERILPEGACLLAAKYKSYKSWLCLGLGLAIAMGGKALGQLEVTPGRVLYLDLEGKQQRIKKRTRAILGVQHVDWPDNFHVFTKWPQGDAGIKELENWFSSYPDTGYVCIDVLGDFRRPIDKHEMGYQYDRDTVIPINELCERYHAASHLVHHFNKVKNVAGDIMDSISGTTGLPSAVNTMWGLSKDPNDSHITILSLRGRDLENDEPIALRWDDYLNLHVVEGPAREVSLSAERKAIMTLLSDDQPRSPKDIAAELGRTVPNIKQLLRKLLDDGLVDKPAYGVYARIPTKGDHSDHSDHSGISDHSGNSVENGGKSDRNVQRVIGDFSSDHSLNPVSERVNGKSDRSDRYYRGNFSIDCAELDGDQVWRLWDDDKEEIVGVYPTEQAAIDAAKNGGSAQ